MKSSMRSGVFAAITAVFAGMPALVHACPMCFAGGSENTDAFLYGSLFLMVVPTTTLGGLGYWVYRRIKTIDDGMLQAEPDEAAVDQPANNSGSAVVLNMSTRR